MMQTLEHPNSTQRFPSAGRAGRQMKGPLAAVRQLAVAGALGLALVTSAGATTYAVPANSHYFANFTWSTFSTSTPPNPATAPVNIDPVTGGWLAGIPFSVSGPDLATLGNQASRYFEPNWSPASLLPVGTDYPSAAIAQHNIGRGTRGQPVDLTYTFAAPLPLSTHFFVQDVDGDVTGIETARFTFKTCGGAVINPSGWDDVDVTTNTSGITRNFSATDITLQGSNTSANEPVIAIVMRDATVCQIEVDGDFPTGSVQLYFAVPPTDPSVVKTSSAGSFYKGGPVQWNLTATNTSPAQSGIPGVANPTQAYGVTLTDTVDAAVSGVTASIVNAGGTTGGACTVGAGNAVSCSGFSPLANGASIVVKVSGTLAADYAGSTLANTAVLTSTAPIDLNPNNNTSTAEIGTTAAPAPVPTLSEWMLIGLGLFLAGLAALRLRATRRI